MRIISQDRTIDIPYDNVIVYVHQIYVKIYVSGIDYNHARFSIGEYHNREDAKYVMALIRDAVIFGKTYFYMPTLEEFSEKISPKGGFRTDCTRLSHIHHHSCSSSSLRPSTYRPSLVL